MTAKRFLVVVVIGLVALGAVGMLAPRLQAQAPSHTSVQGQPAAAGADTEQNGAGADADSLEVGDQNGPDAEAEAGESADQDTDHEELQVGAATDTETEADGAEAGESEDQEAAPSGNPAITAEQAKAAAETYLKGGAATKVELDDENGALVYDVEIGSTDVKVDAMTGAVLRTESAED